MEMNKTDKLIALTIAAGAALMVALALAGSARAASYSNGFQLAKFKVEIKGWQNTIQRRTHEAENECDVSDHSFGRERVTFETTKPIYITATHMKGEFNPQLFGGPQLGIPAKAKVQRSYTPAITMPAVPCEDNGGGAEASKPDCGTKIVKQWRLNLQFGREKKNGLLLSGNGDQDPYVNCPSSGIASFPWLLVEGSGHKGKYIYADLSQDELFDPQFQKWISIANGSATDSGSDWWTKTDVHWEVSFTRLKGKK